MAVTMFKQLISNASNMGKSGTNHPKYLVIHDTGNRAKTADAMNHYKWLQNHNDTNASAHVFVDDHGAVQVIDYLTPAWHTGKRYVPHPQVPDCTNSNSIGIEFCINQGSDLDRTLLHTVDVVKQLMKDWNIPIENVITHQMSSGKTCPLTFIEQPERYEAFMERLKAPSQEVIEAIQTLHEASVIQNVDYWLIHYQDVPYLEQLILNMAKTIQ